MANTRSAAVHALALSGLANKAAKRARARVVLMNVVCDDRAGEARRAVLLETRPGVRPAGTQAHHAPHDDDDVVALALPS